MTDWKDYLSFRRMVTPIIIQIIFWIGVAVVVISGVVMFFGGLISGIGGDGGVGTIFAALIGAPIVTILGVLLVRLYTELLIVIFKINDTLQDIRDALERR